MTSTPPRHTIPIQQVVHILQGAQRQGVAVEPLLQRAGIPAQLLGAPLARVTQGQYAALTRVLRRTLRDEFWGLLRRPVRPGSFAHTCALLVRCRTLHEALQVGLTQYHLLIDDFAPRLHIEAGMATVRLHTRVPREPVVDYAERAFAFLSYGLASWLVARRIPLVQVLYTCPSRKTLPDDAERLFQAPVTCDQPHMAWRFSAEWLLLPVVQSGPSLTEFLRQAPGNLLLRYRDQSSLGERIRRLLRPHLAGEMPTLEAVGHSLGLAPQTLRRRLRDEGHGFQALKDDLRRDAAIEHLVRTDFTLLDIALKLGFSEASTFHRAFKHWTGVAPGAYRLRHRDAHDRDAHDRDAQDAGLPQPASDRFGQAA